MGSIVQSTLMISCNVKLADLLKGVDDLLVGQLHAGGVSRLVVHVEPEHLSVNQVHLIMRNERARLS